MQHFLRGKPFKKYKLVCSVRINFKINFKINFNKWDEK